MTENEAEPKIGAGHASAMFRQGLSELRAALYTDSNVAQPTQYGIFGTRTPGEVMKERGVDARDPDESPGSVHGDRAADTPNAGREPEADAPSVLEGRLSQAKERDAERDREPREPDRE